MQIIDNKVLLFHAAKTRAVTDVIEKSAVVDGKVAEQGGPELAERLEAEGYDRYVKAN